MTVAAASPPSVGTARGSIALAREDGTVVCQRCTVADRMFSRMKGLLGRKSLAEGEGILLRPAPSIHTFFMRFPIDVVFLSKEGEVLKVAEDVRPWRARSCRGAHSVLELSAGETQRRGIAVGQRLAPQSEAGIP